MAASREHATARPECVYVVGAGFSAALGYPLISDLLYRFWLRNDDSTFKVDLRRIIEFHNPGFNPSRFWTFPNIEKLLSEMQVNEQLFRASRQYEGKFTLAKLRHTRRELLLNVAKWFYRIADEPKSAAQNDWLRRFKERVVHEKATVISFNWDVELEHLLFDGHVDGTHYGLARRIAAPLLLKPHGSLNWYEGKLGKHLKQGKAIRIFEHKGGKSVYAFLPERLPKSHSDRKYVPLIVPPVLLKEFGAPVFQHLWRRCVSEISRAKKVVFLGYSMPDADLHVQFILRCGFSNQAEGELINGQRANPTGAAEVVIVNPDERAAKRTLAVIGRKNTCEWVSSPVADWVMNEESI